MGAHCHSCNGIKFDHGESKTGSKTGWKIPEYLKLTVYQLTALSRSLIWASNSNSPHFHFLPDVSTPPPPDWLATLAVFSCISLPTRIKLSNPTGIAWICRKMDKTSEQELGRTEPPHDKINKMACVPSLIRVAWASAKSDQSSLSAWRKLGSLATH